MEEKNKEGANGEEEEKGRGHVSQRWTQKTQATEIQRQRGQPSEKETGTGRHGDSKIPEISRSRKKSKDPQLCT